MDERKPHLLDDLEHWRKRAAENRALAQDLKDPETRKMLEEVAEKYERLALRADARAAGRSA